MISTTSRFAPPIEQHQPADVAVGQLREEIRSPHQPLVAQSTLRRTKLLRRLLPVSSAHVPTRAAHARSIEPRAAPPVRVRPHRARHAIPSAFWRCRVYLLRQPEPLLFQFHPPAFELFGIGRAEHRRDVRRHSVRAAPCRAAATGYGRASAPNAAAVRPVRESGGRLRSRVRRR